MIWRARIALARLEDPKSGVHLRKEFWYRTMHGVQMTYHPRPQLTCWLCRKYTCTWFINQIFPPWSYRSCIRGRARESPQGGRRGTWRSPWCRSQGITQIHSRHSTDPFTAAKSTFNTRSESSRSFTLDLFWKKCLSWSTKSLSFLNKSLP